MSILSKGTTEVQTTAAFEVLFRGTGDRGQYNYTVQDCLLVAAAFEQNKVSPMVWLVSQDGCQQTTLNLFDVIKRKREMRTRLQPHSGVV